MDYKIGTQPIKRIINYCWFGGNPKSELILKCIDSWKRFFPEYEIIEWNETNFDIHCCKYVEEAYASKKWAFVSDYCRVWVLYHYGGIYFDTDVQVIKNTNIFETNCVGFEKRKLINPGLAMASEKGSWFCKEMLDEYNKDSFIIDDKHNYRTICDRATDIFKVHGLKLNNKHQLIDGFNVYPSDYFNPMGNSGGTIKMTNNTVSIHLFSASWVDDEYIKNFKPSFRGKIYRILSSIFGKRFADFVRRVFN